MSISSDRDDLLKLVQCCFSSIDDGHFISEPVDCGRGNACRTCVADNIKCASGEVTNRELELSMPDVRLLKEKYETMGECLKGENLSHELDYRVDCIENDIDIRIESLIDELNKHRVELRSDLKQLRGKIEASLIARRLNEDRLKLDFNVHDYNDFLNKQETMRNIETRYNAYRKEILKIGIHVNTEIGLDRAHIGQLVKPFIDFNRIKSISEIRCGVQEPRRVAFLKKFNTLFITDVRENSIKLVNVEDYSLICTFRHDSIRMPYCIDTTTSEVFVYDIADEAISIFEYKKSTLVYSRQIKLSRDSLVSDIRVNTNRLYVSSIMDDRISVWNSETSEYIRSVEINHPSYMEFSDDRLFVASYTNCEESTESRKLVKIHEGLNCILVFAKTTLEYLFKIEFDTWLKPSGLYLDSYNNLLTTAFEVDNGIISKNRYLYTIGDDGCLLHKIELPDIVNNYYIRFIEHRKLFVSFDRALKVIQFE